MVINMHQQQLIEARNAAASGSGSLQMGGRATNFDMMKLANQVFAPVTY